MAEQTRKRRRRGLRRKRESFWARYFRALRFYLVTGLMVWVPLIVSAWLAWWLFKNIGLNLERSIQNLYLQLNEWGMKYPRFAFLQEFRYVPGTGFGLAVALFLSTGFLTRYIAGRQIIATTEKVVDRIPFVSRIYRSVQQIRDVFVNREGAVFQRVVVLELFRKGVFAVGFVTSEEHGVVQIAADKKLIAIFVPTTPNPTSGFLLYLPPEDLHPLDITVEEAMKLIVSGGAYIPGLVEGKAVGKPVEITQPTAHYEP